MSAARLASALDRVREAASAFCAGCRPLQRRLEAVEREQLELRQLLLAGGRRPVDPARDGELLAAIAAWRGSAVFSVADLRQAADPELAALVAGIGPRALGSWLRRLRRRRMGPYAIERIGRDGSGSLWALRCL
jgi:hypothetical protein